MLFARAGWADPMQEARAAAARSHYEKGRAAYQRGDFEQAVAAFLAAHELDPAPILLFNVAQSYWKKGEPGPAARHYRRYLEADPTASNRAQVEARIRELETTHKPSPPPKPPAPPLVLAAVRAPAETPPPLLRRPWFWGAVGGLLAGAVAVGLLVRSNRLEGWSCSTCNFPTQRVPGP